jgi:CBS-domain-containing membrane protein
MHAQSATPLTVREVMKTELQTVSSSTPTLGALEIMQKNRVGCLPVVDDDRLVGILTSFDFLSGAARLFKHYLANSNHEHQEPKVLHANASR